MLHSPRRRTIPLFRCPRYITLSPSDTLGQFQVCPAMPAPAMREASPALHRALPGPCCTALLMPHWHSWCPPPLPSDLAPVLLHRRAAHNLVDWARQHEHCGVGCGEDDVHVAERGEEGWGWGLDGVATGLCLAWHGLSLHTLLPHAVLV